MSEIVIEDLSVRYGATDALRGLRLRVPARAILGVIGPARSGKTTLLRVLNRLAQEVDGAQVTGRVILDDGEDLLAGSARVLRRRVGMVFATPQVLPGSVAFNLCYGPRLLGLRGAALRRRMEEALVAAQLFEEVKDRLDDAAARLSGGQQQRLCIARALALRPEVLLLDEPCSALDPGSTEHIEATLRALASEVTLILVTNQLQQARRVADRVAFLHRGRLVEDGDAAAIFSAPRESETADYLAGRFG